MELCKLQDNRGGKKAFVSFSMQEHCHKFWLALIILQPHRMRKNVLESAKSCDFGAARSRMQVQKLENVL